MKVLQVHDKEVVPVGAGDGAAGDTPFLLRAGGLGIYMAHVEQALRERGVEVAVAALRPEPRETGDPDRHELQAFRYRLRPSVVARLEEIVETSGVDVVHLHSMPTLHPVLVKRLLRMRPVVWTFHDVTPFCYRSTKLRPDGSLCDRPQGYGCVTGGCYRPGADGPLPGDLLRVLLAPRQLRLYGSATELLVPSAYMADLLAANGIPRERVRVVPLFSRYAVEDGAPPRAEPRLLFVGRLTEDKGLLHLADALARLRELPWTARLVGEGPARDAFVERVRAAGLAERVELPGPVHGAALADELRACDALVVPSLVPESFGLVGVEAMSFARPVVAFEAGGVTEWLADGVNGLLARRGDAEDLAAKLGSVLAEPELRARLGGAGARRVREEFSIERHAEQLDGIYAGVAAAARRPSGPCRHFASAGVLDDPQRGRLWGRRPQSAGRSRIEAFRISPA
jgi:glycosyltransferase involved in cell wall biosynthesis